MARTERDVVYTYTTGRAEDSARFQRLFIDADNTATRMCAHRKNIRPLVPLTFLSLRGYVDNAVTLWCGRSNITPEDFMRTTLHTLSDNLTAHLSRLVPDKTSYLDIFTNDRRQIHNIRVSLASETRHIFLNRHLVAR
jgi:hypothetical protein